MRYTTFEYTPSESTTDRRIIELLDSDQPKQGRSAYLLCIKTPEKDLPTHPKTVKVVAMEGVDDEITDIIFAGSKKDAQKLANTIFEETGTHVGIAKYQGAGISYESHRRARIAQSAAEREQIPFHTYRRE